MDTAEYMLGKVAVTPVFLESDGRLDDSTENWTPALTQSTLESVQTGVEWWADTLAAQNTVHSLDFVWDESFVNTPVPTKYEPISRVSNDYVLWAQDFLKSVNADKTGNLETDMRMFNHAQRLKLGTDWSYTIFVINSHNDVDHQFAQGGQFRDAFAFAGGLFVVSPSTRPPITYAHETGHIFWAKDEYVGGAPYSGRRGYYGTQNWNAADNPALGFLQQPSIMSSGQMQQIAYDLHISPPSTLAMIGWQDTDNDRIYDVLDVPLELTGSGAYDVAAAKYRFKGLAQVGLLPNLNTAGLKNDISLNNVSAIEYRIDNGSWQIYSQPNVPQLGLDLSIAVSPSNMTVDIRVLDAATGITSNVFRGRLAHADAVAAPGISGLVWIDGNKNKARDRTEAGAEGWTVELRTSSDQPLNLRRSVEPDSLPDGVIVPGSLPGLIISSIGADADGRVAAFTDTAASAQVKTFRAFSLASQSWLALWNGTTRRMKVEFASPTSIVEIDAVGAAAGSYGRLEAYDIRGKLVDRFTTGPLGNGQVATMRVETSTDQIAYIVVGSHINTFVRLDNLRYGPQTTVITKSHGLYAFEHLPAGSYLVKVAPLSVNGQAVPAGGDRQLVTIGSGGSAGDVDLATQGAIQNPSNVLDVNADASVSALDVLLIVNDINRNGPRSLLVTGYVGPPYLDVSGDGFCSALDALLVINHINLRVSGEGSDDLSGKIGLLTDAVSGSTLPRGSSTASSSHAQRPIDNGTVGSTASGTDGSTVGGEGERLARAVNGSAEASARIAACDQALFGLAIEHDLRRRSGRPNLSGSQAGLRSLAT